MKIAFLLGTIIIITAVTGGGCSASNKTPSRVQLNIEYVGGGTEGWRPNAVSISAGGVVTWINKGNFLHSVISGEGLFNETVSQGQSFNYTFSKPGTYTYHDDPDNELCTIIVKNK